MVSIVAFQAVDPGSIPGHRRGFIFIFKICCIFSLNNLFILLLSFSLNNEISTAMVV